MDWTHYLDFVLFGVLPYVALVTFFVGTIQRYRSQKFTYSSLSSQFLENQHHFWGLVPFHYGILAVLTGHIIAFAIPAEILWWNSHPLRLYILEISALIFAILTIVGLVAAMVRRVTNPKIWIVTSVADWVIYLLLLIQVISGIYIAVFFPWGSSWFAATAVPYLWSVLKLHPEISYIVDMPWMVKVHIINAALLIGFFPFTRLVHILVTPNPYLWRKPQVVRWYRRATVGSQQ